MRETESFLEKGVRVHSGGRHRGKNHSFSDRGNSKDPSTLRKASHDAGSTRKKKGEGGLNSSRGRWGKKRISVGEKILPIDTGEKDEQKTKITPLGGELKGGNPLISRDQPFLKKRG